MGAKAALKEEDEKIIQFNPVVESDEDDSSCESCKL
jgi:hypothetical protein